MKSKWTPFIVIFLSTLILSVNHIYNGFPLFLVDSIGYLERAQGLTESSHWSNTYTLFLFTIFKLFGSVHFAAIAQNLIVVSVLYLFCKYHLFQFNHYKFIALISLLFFTSLTWISTMIMSDIFTPISILCIILLLEKPLLTYEKIVIASILFIGLSAHQSHILILPLFAISVVLSMSLFSKAKRSLLFKKAIFILALFFCSNYFERNIMDYLPTYEKKELSLSQEYISECDEEIQANEEVLPEGKSDIFKNDEDSTKSEVDILIDEQITTEGDEDISKSIKSESKDKIVSKYKSEVSSGYYFLAIRLAEAGKLRYLLKHFCVDSNRNYLCIETNKWDASRINTTHYNSRNSSNLRYINYSNDNKEFVLYSLTSIQTYYGFAHLVIKRGFSLLKETKIKKYHKLKWNHIERLEKAIEQINPYEAKVFLASNQVKRSYGYYKEWTYNKWLFVWWKVLLPLSLLIFFVLLFKNIKSVEIPLDRFMVIIYLCYGHILNVLISGTFSNFENVRYSSRTLWLVNICIIFTFYYLFIYMRKRNKIVSK